MTRKQESQADGDSMSAFARAMQIAGRPSKVVDFPGLKGVRVALWAPTEADEAEADAEARKHLTKVLGLDALQLSLAVETVLHSRERDVQLLALVLRDPDDPEQAFTESPEELRERLLPPQRESLIRLVNAFALERYPIANMREPGEVMELVRSLKADGALSDFLISCDGDTARSIALCAAEAWLTPTTQTCSDASCTK